MFIFPKASGYSKAFTQTPSASSLPLLVPLFLLLHLLLQYSPLLPAFLLEESFWPPAAAAAAKSLQLCSTVCDPRDGSPPGFAVPGILQARTLEWVAIAFSNAWKWKLKVKSLSCVRLLATPWTIAHQAPPSMGFSRQEYWSGVPRLNQTVFMYSCWLCPYLHVVNWVLYCMWVDLHIQWNIYCSLCFN